MNIIKLNIDGKIMEVELFDHPIADELFKLLPLTIDLTCWGNEAYGAIPLKEKAYQTRATIPPGGLAYSEQGNYLCLFYGQTPAWPVDFIGRIRGDWQQLVGGSYSKLTLEK